MKIDPGFISHWKTELLMDRLGSDGVVAVLRLWGNAQIRRQFTGLELNPRRLALETKWKGNAEDLFNTLTDPDAPWLDEDEDGTYSIHDFGQHQKQVVALWENGSKGGRPRKVSPAPSSKEEKNNHPLPLPLTPLGFEMKPNGFQTKPNGFEDEDEESLCDRVFQEVSTIRKPWAATPFNAAEKRQIMENAAVFRSISPEQWQTIRQFHHAKLEKGDASFQPRFRHKLLDSISTVAAQADHWQRKAQSKAQSIQTPTNGHKTQERRYLSRDEIAEMLKP